MQTTVRDYLEEKISQGQREHKVPLVELIVREKEDLCLPEEVDKERVYSLLEESRLCDKQLQDVCALIEGIALHEIQEDLRSLSNYAQQVRFLASPFLSLVIKEGKFYYTLNKYKKEISQESALSVLERAFARDHCYP
jgi:hypothetical protein